MKNQLIHLKAQAVIKSQVAPDSSNDTSKAKSILKKFEDDFDFDDESSFDGAIDVKRSRFR